MNNVTLNNVSSYAVLLDSIKAHIRDSRIRAFKGVNKELISLYYAIGQSITEDQAQHGWGKSIVERLANDLKQTFPGQGGFSPQNLWYMRQFYLEYKDDEKLQQLVGEIPWGHNVLLMSKIKDITIRKYYLTTCIQMGWSRNVLLHQIKSQAYERHCLAPKQHNFNEALPKHLAAQADEALKDVYLLDMLGITEPVLEAELEQRMVEKIKGVMLEFGYGFSFIGNQYRIAVNGREYFIDMLFFNRKWRGLVALELKVGKFKPEYAGKMNFYLNLLNEYVREEGENPAIGIILCTERDHFEVEFSLKGLDKPMGVAEYQLTRDLPQELQGKLPDAKQLEEKFRSEMGSFSESEKS